MTCSENKIPPKKSSVFMERKLSDKERFIIQVAVNRSAENHFDRQKGWKRVKRCTNNGYIIRRRHSWLAICVSALCLLSGSGYLFTVTSLFIPRQFSPSPEIYKADGIPVLTLEKRRANLLNPNQSLLSGHRQQPIFNSTVLSNPSDIYRLKLPDTILLYPIIHSRSPKEANTGYNWPTEAGYG